MRHPKCFSYFLYKNLSKFNILNMVLMGCIMYKIYIWNWPVINRGRHRLGWMSIVSYIGGSTSIQKVYTIIFTKKKEKEKVYTIKDQHH